MFDLFDLKEKMKHHYPTKVIALNSPNIKVEMVMKLNISAQI